MASFYFSYEDDKVRVPPPESPIQRAEKRHWQYATHDPIACADLATALGRSCRRGRTITYAELARGVTFRLPSINQGQPYIIDIQNQSRISPRDQHILDDFLCFLSLQSVKGASILASANVIDPSDRRGASNGFFETARVLGYHQADDARLAGRQYDSKAEMRNIMFWNQELKKVYAWFAAHPVHS